MRSKPNTPTFRPYWSGQTSVVSHLAPIVTFTDLLLHRHDLHVVVLTILDLADVVDRLLAAAVAVGSRFVAFPARRLEDWPQSQGSRAASGIHQKISIQVYVVIKVRRNYSATR